MHPPRSCGGSRFYARQVRLARLFVGIDVSDDARQALAALLPGASQGVRPAPPEQMHITLHYIGIGDVERVRSALNTLSAPAFFLSIQGVGKFSSADNTLTLWAGVAENGGLRRLHASVAGALSVDRTLRTSRLPAVTQFGPVL
jgi:2'-5' RNA ligase